MYRITIKMSNIHECSNVYKCPLCAYNSKNSHDLYR